MPIPLVIITSFNVLFSVLVFLLLFSFHFFFLPHFIALPLTSATNISGEVFLSLSLSFPSPCTASSQAFSVNVFR